MTSQSPVTEWLTWAFSPAASAIFFTLFLAIALPICLHIYLYRSRARALPSTFLLVGPSGAGKTTIATLFQSGQPSRTHTSQELQTVQCSLPSENEAASQGFRSNQDPTVHAERQFTIIDTPGHGKLRHFASDTINENRNLKGILFVVDAAAISSPKALTETAGYLHDLLLQLQKRQTGGKTSKGAAPPPVLIAANKLDLFTALPAQLVRKALEDEITNVRNTRSKGLLDSAAGVDDQGDEREWLGDGGEGAFKFSQLAESEIEVQVAGGNAVGERGEGGDVKEWWAWIRDNM